jgi:hypothetical protein
LWGCRGQIETSACVDVETELYGVAADGFWPDDDSGQMRDKKKKKMQRPGVKKYKTEEQEMAGK